MFVNNELRKKLSEQQIKKLQKNKKFLVLETYERHVKNMSDAEAGYLFKTMLDYIVNGQDYNMTDPKMAKIQLLFEDFKAENDGDILDWLEVSNQNKKNAQKRWDNANDKSKNLDENGNQTKHPKYG